MKYDYLVFIGRFQPFHIGHQAVIEKALQIANRVIVLVGSAGKPRSSKNPWTFQERAEMILKTTSNGVLGERIAVVPLYDKSYNDSAWVAQVQSIVETVVRADGFTATPNIGIIGHVKDESSYYLKMFPQWGLVEHDMNEVVHATDLRSILFDGKSLRYLQGLLPAPVFDSVEEFTKTPTYDHLKQEHDYIKGYRRAWESAPYPPTFITTDAIVVQSGHILLIQRKAAPGKGLWALPGGFLDQKERIVDGIIRELYEETRLKVPKPVLRGSITKREVFDDPGRSERGRIVTHAALIELPPGELPQVKGADDARRAKWVPISDLREDNMFEDHYAIIQAMLGLT